MARAKGLFVARLVACLLLGGALFACKKAPPPSPSLSDTPIERARQAEREGRPAEVRRLLEEAVHGADALPEEVRLVRGACKAQKDQACLDDLRRRYR